MAEAANPLTAYLGFDPDSPDVHAADEDVLWMTPKQAVDLHKALTEKGPVTIKGILSDTVDWKPLNDAMIDRELQGPMVNDLDGDDEDEDERPSTVPTVSLPVADWRKLQGVTPSPALHLSTPGQETLAAALHNNPRRVLALALRAIFLCAPVTFKDSVLSGDRFATVRSATNKALRELANDPDYHREILAAGWVAGNSDT